MRRSASGPRQGRNEFDERYDRVRAHCVGPAAAFGLQAGRSVVSEATTSILADYVAEMDYRDLSAAVRGEVRRLFVNWVGCALGGSSHEAIRTAVAAMRELAGPAEAGIFGRGERFDAASAALINCMSSAVLTFDDTHLRSITHPGGPAAAAAIALAERRPIDGAELLTAIALGVEATCRLGAMLTVPPAGYNLSLFMTGITGTVGAALAAGKLMRLDRDELQFAIGIAASQSAGLREMHGTMASSLVCGNAARAGLVAATLAKHGFTSGLCSIEGPKGLGNVFGSPANPSAVTAGLGNTYELLSISYKPYPCGIAVHPAIDAAREILAASRPKPEAIAACEVTLHPVGLTLTGRPHPQSALEAQVSVPHWVAATLVHGTAGLAEATDACVRDPAVVALREKVTMRADENMAPTAAAIAVTLTNGRLLQASVEHCRGSSERPLTDEDLSGKFIGQAVPALGRDGAERLLELCWSVETSDDVAAIARASARQHDSNEIHRGGVDAWG
jgi:2-methylcitrate dehydratase PrpD